MKNVFLAALCGAILISAPTARAQQVKQPRTVGAFQGVHTGGGIDVVLTQGSTAAVVVEASAEAQQHLRTTVENGILQIGWEQEGTWRKLTSSRNLGHSVVYVTCPRLTALSVSGGSDAKGESEFSADNMQLSTSGGGNIRLALSAKALTSSASGGGNVYLTGQADQQNITVSGGSDYHAFGLQSRTADVHASGGSDVELAVSGELSSDTSGGSGVSYKGAARVVKSHASGGGGIRQVR
jgi:uncharacterized protein RhaS with RHS repeats